MLLGEFLNCSVFYTHLSKQSHQPRNQPNLSKSIVDQLWLVIDVFMIAQNKLGEVALNCTKANQKQQQNWQNIHDICKRAFQFDYCTENSALNFRTWTENSTAPKKSPSKNTKTHIHRIPQKHSIAINSIGLGKFLCYYFIEHTLLIILHTIRLMESWFPLQCWWILVLRWGCSLFLSYIFFFLFSF